MTCPHPQTLFHLEPADDFTANAVSRGCNYHVSTSRYGILSLEVGYHVSQTPSGHVIARLGRNTDLQLDPTIKTISQVHVAFEISPRTFHVVLCVRSTRDSSVSLGTLVRGRHGMTIEHNTVLTATGDGVLLVNQEYRIQVHQCKFNLVWRLESAAGETQRLIAEECQRSRTGRVNLPREAHATETPGILTWLPTIAATTGKDMVKELDDTKRERREEGHFGQVFATTDAISGKAIAVKVIALGPDQTQMHRALVAREIAIMKQLQHANIIKCLGEQNLQTENPGIFMPLCSGSVSKLVRTLDGNDLKVACSELLKNMLMALAYLAKNDFVHRDIKPDNILYSLKVDRDTSATSFPYLFQLSDFGLANCLMDARTYCGTQYYQAPELHPYQSEVVFGQSHQMDVWSLYASIIACLVTFRQCPVMSRQYSDQMCTLLQFKKRYPQLEPMARLDPRRRVSAATMLAAGACFRQRRRGDPAPTSPAPASVNQTHPCASQHGRSASSTAL